MDNKATKTLDRSALKLLVKANLRSSWLVFVLLVAVGFLEEERRRRRKVLDLLDPLWNFLSLALWVGGTSLYGGLAASLADNLLNPQVGVMSSMAVATGVQSFYLLSKNGREKLRSYLAEAGIDPAWHAEIVFVASITYFLSAYSVSSNAESISFELSNSARTYYESNQIQKAWETLDISLALNPDNGCALQVKGALFEDQEDYASAEKSYKAAIALNDLCYANSVNNLARIRALQQQFGTFNKFQTIRTIAILQVALSRVAGQEDNDEIASNLLVKLGWLRFLNSEKERALVALFKALEGGNQTANCVIMQLEEKDNSYYAKLCLQAIGRRDLIPRVPGLPEEDFWRARARAIIEGRSDN